MTLTVTVSDVRDPGAEASSPPNSTAFNREKFGRVDTQTLDILVRDANAEGVGGLLGRSSLGLFFPGLFYLPAALRGGGLGSRLIVQAEQEARRRGCTAA